MPRHPRIHQPELLFHIMARGNNKQKIFNSPKDYTTFLSMLRETKQRYHFKLYAYALMPNHIHLLVQVSEQPSARIMQSVLTGYARYFNRAYKRSGHLFQGRYKSILCERDAYAMWLVRYIHLNPVRAHLVGGVDQWKWTGHAEYNGTAKKDLIDAGVVAELFGKGAAGAANYREYVSEGLAQGCKYDEDLHPSESAPFLGSDSFKEEVVYKIDPPARTMRKALQDIILEQTQDTGVTPEMVLGKSRKKKVAMIRKNVIRKAVTEYGYIASELARQLNRSEAYISMIVG